METRKYNPDKVLPFIPFYYGAEVFGGHFGDEGKGKVVDIIARDFKERGLNILSVRGQGGGNAGHTVVVDGKKYDFHYLTSAGLSADIMLLGAGMLIDPIRVLEEAKKLPEEKRKIIVIDERAVLCSNLDRYMDEYTENARKSMGSSTIGTTKSGVGPCESTRRSRIHLTFADTLRFKNAEQLYEALTTRPFVPDEINSLITPEYAKQLFDAVCRLNVVNSQKLFAKCRNEKNWAVLLEVSQAVGLDPYWGRDTHFVTSTSCTNVGAAAGAGLTYEDFPSGSFMILKAYASQVGSGPFITMLNDDEKAIADFIYDLVGECGVTTGRKRNLGWFDAVAVRMAVSKTGTYNLCINCMDVLGKIPGGKAKICYAYQNKVTGVEEYDYPTFHEDYEPLYEEIPCSWDIDNVKNLEDLPESVFKFIEKIEELTGARVKYIGTGPSSEDIIDLYPGEIFVYDRKSGKIVTRKQFD